MLSVIDPRQPDLLHVVQASTSAAGHQALANPSPGCEAGRVRPSEEIVQFIASLSPREVIEFKPSETARQRVWDLIGRQKATPLPADAKAELDDYLEVEHLMRLAKARARQLLAHGQPSHPKS